MITHGDHTEKEWLVKVAAGDEAAFRAVYDRYKEPFYAAAFKMTRSAETAEDIVQEVFTALWKKRNLVGDAVNPVGYLMTILHNAIYYHFRKIGWEREMKKNMAHQIPDEENPVEELLLEKENREILQSIIGQLSPQQQLVYRLSKQEGLSREEIAEKLNISPNTVKNHLAEAVHFIRNYFKKGASAIIWALIWNNL